MSHERETLDAVIQARNSAMEAEQKVAANPSDPAAVREHNQAEAQLGGSLGRLFALSEAYPDLKANQNMLALQEELTSTENRIGFARQAFNDAAANYNIQREVFPAVKVAGVFGFKEAALLHRHLDAQFLQQPQTRPVHSSPQELEHPVATVLALLAWDGHPEPGEAAVAFDTGMRAFIGGDHTHDLPPREECSLGEPFQGFHQPVRAHSRGGRRKRAQISRPA